jgi:hypothetical protein
MRRRRLPGDRNFPRTKLATIADSLDINPACTAMKYVPEALCYFLSAIAMRPPYILAIQVPAVEPGGLSAPPPARPSRLVCVSVRYNHLKSGLPVLGVRFGGLKAVRVWLLQRATRNAVPVPHLGSCLVPLPLRNRKPAAPPCSLYIAHPTPTHQHQAISDICLYLLITAGGVPRAVCCVVAPWPMAMIPA